MFFKTSALVALAATVSGHLIMEEPKPFQWEDAATKQSPLEVADFPCKQRAGTYASTGTNSYNAGDTINVKIIGGATHGGGSCQFALTTDEKPTKQSQWKVIQSNIGGCPYDGKPTDNKSQDPTDRGIPEIPVKLPENLPAGQYTFSWSWQNKIGNREWYQNCAPIEVGGGANASAASADVESVLGSLPDMFTINLPNTECGSVAYQDFEYPNPGDNVVKGSGATPGASMTGAGCAKVTALGAGSGKLGSPAQATGGAGSSAQATTAPTSSTGQAGGIFAPGASSAASAIPTSQAPVQATPPVATQPAATQPAVQPSATSVAAAPSTGTGNGTGAPSSGDCTPCTNDGAVVCIGSNQFGLCNRGCAVAQDLAAGMTCSNGAITRRSMRFPRAHLHRRHGSEML